MTRRDLDAPKPRLRRARSADGPHLARLEARLYDHDRITAPEWQEILADPRRETWVLAAPERPPVGLLLLALGRDHLRLEDLGVTASLQGQGLGRRLVRHTLARAHAHGKRRVTLEVRPDNAAALALYAAHGFCRVGTRPRYYEDGSPALRLVLELRHDKKTTKRESQGKRRPRDV